MKSLPDTTFSIETPCESNVNGICEKKETLEECLDTCKEPQCYWGTWSSKNKTCKPIYYSLYKDINPIMMIEKKVGINTFFNTSFFEYPSRRENKIFYYDRVKLQNVFTGYILEPPIRLRMSKPPLPVKALETIPISQSTPILFYDRVLDSVLRVEDSQVNWFKTIEYLNEDYDAFFLEISEQPQKKYIEYNDIFRIKTIQNEYICLPTLYSITKPRLNDLVVSNDKNSKTPDTFRFIPVPKSIEI